MPEHSGRTRRSSWRCNVQRAGSQPVVDGASPEQCGCHMTEALARAKERRVLAATFEQRSLGRNASPNAVKWRVQISTAQSTFSDAASESIADGEWLMRERSGKTDSSWHTVIVPRSSCGRFRVSCPVDETAPSEALKECRLVTNLCIGTP